MDSLLFHMTDIIPLLGLPYPPSERSSYNIACPCCDSGRKKHLNINLRKDIFRCPKCGFAGGVFDLYSHYTGIDRKEVFQDLKKRLGMEDSRPEHKPKPYIPPPVEITEYPPTDIDIRNHTYHALLDTLSLSNDHKNNLLSRGLSEQVITENMYRTTPVVGTQTLAKQLLTDGCYLAGVPGFYRNKSDEWTFVNNQRGILIPVRDIEGRIQGLQIRRDNTRKRKFRWVSSTDRPDGCKAEGWVHISGPIRDQMILIEGPLKADIIHHLTGQTVVAVPGVNTLTQLEIVLTYLKELGVRQIMTAFDMDFLMNHNVQNGYHSLLWMLNNTGIRFGTYLWHPAYNGLDDFVWEFVINSK